MGQHQNLVATQEVEEVSHGSKDKILASSSQPGEMISSVEDATGGAHGGNNQNLDSRITSDNDGQYMSSHTEGNRHTIKTSIENDDRGVARTQNGLVEQRKSMAESHS